MTILGFVPDGDPDLQAKLIDSTLVQFPVISSQLRENVHSLKGSGMGSRSASSPRSTAASAPLAPHRMRSTGRGGAP